MRTLNSCVVFPTLLLAVRLYVRATRTSLLRAARTRGAGQLAPGEAPARCTCTSGASGLLYVPRTVASQVLAEQMQRGKLMGHERAEAMDEMSLLQLGLSAMPRVRHSTAWFDISIGGEAAFAACNTKRPTINTPFRTSKT